MDKAQIVLWTFERLNIDKKVVADLGLKDIYGIRINL